MTPRRSRLRALALLLLALSALGPRVGLATEQAIERLRAAWMGWDDLRVAHARNAVSLTDADFRTLAAGDTVARVARRPEGDRVVGAFVLPVPVESLWVAVQLTESRETGQGVSQTHLPGTGPNRRLLYLYMDAPWPMEDRQAVVDVRHNRALFEASGGDLWERHWKVGDPSLAAEASPEAMWMPVNEGSWHMLRLGPSETLGVVSLRVVVGGIVPDEAAVRWGAATMGGILRNIEKVALDAPARYAASPERVHRPDGRAITVEEL